MKIKVGLIGAGKFGRVHLSGYKKNPKCEIIAIASRTERSAREAADNFNIPNVYWGDSWKEMFEEQNLDAVSICSPNYLHAPMTLMALKNNCHILCEKPIAISLQELNEIEEILSKKNLIYFSSFQKRFLPVTSDIKKLIEIDGLGELSLVRYFFGHHGPYTTHKAMSNQKWFINSKLAGGGVLIDLGVHCIDLLRCLIGEFTEIEGYSYNTSCKRMNAEDNCSVIFQFENNILGNISVTWCSEPMEIIEIFGSKGTLRIDMQSKKPYMYKPKKLKRDPYLKKILKNKYNYNLIPQHALINYFIECIIDNRQSDPSFNDGKRALEFVLKAYSNK